MYFTKRSFAMLLFTGIFLTSCGNQPVTAATPTSELDAILTAGVGTLVASIFQTQSALVPLATETPTFAVVPTNTPLSAVALPVLSTPTLALLNTAIVIIGSPTQTGTQYTPTVNPSTLGYGCNNLFLIRDETIPAGTVFKPGEKFTKTWKVENSGTCDWVYLYRLVYFTGDRMGGSPNSLGKVIVPGKWTQLSVVLTAPSEPGTYTGYWRFGEQSGHMFGSTLGVSIVVKSTSDTAIPPTSTAVSSPTKKPKPPTATDTPVPTDTTVPATSTVGPTETPSETPTP